jgi:hypothetical protein
VIEGPYRRLRNDVVPGVPLQRRDRVPETGRIRFLPMSGWSVASTERPSSKESAAGTTPLTVAMASQDRASAGGGDSGALGVALSCR